MSFLKYLSENYDKLMHNFNQHVQKENIMITFSFYTMFCLKHMIDDVLSLLSKSSCKAVNKKISVNDNNNLSSLSHSQTAIQCDMSDTVKSFCYLFHISDNVITLSHQ